MNLHVHLYFFFLTSSFECSNPVIGFAIMFDFKKQGIIKKNRMSAASMSRCAIGASLI